jgi:hypothetical protein
MSHWTRLTHTRNHGRRYRCNVNQALIQFRPDDAGAVRRVPAHDIESLVTEELLRLLQDCPRLLDGLKPEGAAWSLDVAIFSGAKRVAKGFDALSLWDLKVLLRAVIEKVLIAPREVKVRVARNGLADRLGLDGRLVADPDQGPISILAEARLKRLGGENHLIVKDRTARSSATQADPSLIDGLAQAHAWRMGFLSNPALKLKDVGAEVGQFQTYLSRVMRLAYFAPDLCEAVMQGTQPRDLSLKSMLRGIPLSWVEQRRKFGLASA